MDINTNSTNAQLSQGQTNIDDVLDQTNSVADQINDAADGARSAAGTVFMALLNTMMSEAQANSNSGA